MNCIRFRALVLAYLQSEVDGDLGNEFRWHKHFCDSCRNAYVAAETAVTGRRANRPTSLASKVSDRPASDGPKPSGTREGRLFPGRRRL
jgi:hypothetical protein